MKYLKVFTDFLDVTAQLGDGALGRLFRAMLRYARDGAEPELKGREAVAWAVAKQHIDREKDAYEAMVEARRDAGRSGAKARWEKQAEHGKHSQDKDKEKENENDKEKEKDIYIGAQAPAPKAHIYIEPPSLEEISSYCRERGNQVDPRYFYDYYTSNGWRIGRNPMKDWKATVRSWESNGMAKRAQAKESSYLDAFRGAMDLLSEEEAKQV